jgi:hypothetical protein
LTFLHHRKVRSQTTNNNQENFKINLF